MWTFKFWVPDTEINKQKLAMNIWYFAFIYCYKFLFWHVNSDPLWDFVIQSSLVNLTTHQDMHKNLDCEKTNKKLLENAYNFGLGKPMQTKKREVSQQYLLANRYKCPQQQKDYILKVTSFISGHQCLAKKLVISG